MCTASYIELYDAPAPHTLIPPP